MSFRECRFIPRFGLVPILYAALIGLGGTLLPLFGGNDRIEVNATTDIDPAHVGDLIEFSVEATYPKELVATMPEQGATLGSFEVRDHRVQPPEELADGRLRSKSIFKLTAFETGQLEIPSLELRFLSLSGETEQVVSTEPVAVQVESVLSAETTDILDIKPPLTIERDWLPIIIGALVGGALLASAVYWYLRHRKRGRNSSVVVAEDMRPAHEIALEALDRIRTSGVLDRGEVSAFHIRVSEVIRCYFEGRFGIEALEETSREILEDLQAKGISVSNHSLCLKFLNQCDLVKFAKLAPSKEKSEKVLDLAHEIVESTKFIPAPIVSSMPASEADSEVSGAVKAEKAASDAVTGGG